MCILATLEKVCSVVVVVDTAEFFDKVAQNFFFKKNIGVVLWIKISLGFAHTVFVG